MKRNIILPSKKFFGAIEEDLSLRINLDETKNLLREGDRTIILDNALLFEKERNESNNYKIHGKLKMVFRNMYSGQTSYPPLRNLLYLAGDGSDGDFTGFLPYDEFAFLRKDVLREVNDPISTSNLNSFTQNIITSGQSQHQSITSIQAPFHNWNIYLSYVFSGDTEYPMKYTLSGGTVFEFLSGDGIPFRVEDNGSTYRLVSPVEHGMIDGEFITISGGSLNNTIPVSGRTFLITSIGNEIYNSNKYVLDISKSEIPSGTTLGTVVFGKRCLDRKNITGTTSTYYVHKHKTLTLEKDYILDKIGFESPIWENEKKLLFENSSGENDVLVERNRMESLVYDFKSPFVLTGLTNNLGYTPTDVYVTVVFINGNGFFEYPPKVGWKFNFHDSWIDEHFDGDSSVEKTIPVTAFTRTINSITYSFTGGTELPIGTILNGAFVEYNETELKERVVSDAYHRISNPVNVFDYGQDGDTSGFSGASATNLFGLYYQPHHMIKLRQLSPYIETSTTKDVFNIPQNARYSEDEKLWRWRDLYDHGFIDPEGFGTNYPYINNIHYVKNDINFYLRNENLYTNKQDLIEVVTRFKC